MKTVETQAGRWALFGAIALWICVSVLPNPRPNPIPATAPAEVFSAERAMVHVAAIAQKPHPTLSAEWVRVRDYVRGELRKSGLEPQVQSGIGKYSKGQVHKSGSVENIVARLSGSANTRPLMLAAHYDSSANGPGASDDAHGVAVLLETLRALRSGPPLRNDVIFLLTDGEEQGLLGADVFMREHPWRHESGVVLNFEARGTGGPSYMFETSAGNAWLIDALASAVPRAEATSVAYEIYRRMPNDTDLTVFKRGGLNGMNFAFIGHPEFYHRPQDDVAHLDQQSVQENGNYALGLARVFGNRDLTPTHSGNAIYFPMHLMPLIVYPDWWAGPLAWFAVASLIAATWFGRRARDRWLAAGLAIVAALAVLISRTAPGASYLLEWPLLAGVVAFALVVTGPRALGWGWRLSALAILPAAVFPLLVPFASTLLVALPFRRAAPILGAVALVILMCLAPQIALLLRRNRV
jgi:hypothetical protein